MQGLDVHRAGARSVARRPTDFPPSYMQDELRYRVRHELFLRPDQTTFTSATSESDSAADRNWGAFMPPNGVGGAECTGNAETFRFLPSDFVLKTISPQRRRRFSAQGHDDPGRGVTFDDLEPHYGFVSNICVAHRVPQAILARQVQDGGNPFEARGRDPIRHPRSRSRSVTRCCEGGAELGYKPFPQRREILSKAYTNRSGCVSALYVLWLCEWFGCGNYSKASPQTTLTARPGSQSNFAVRDNRSRQDQHRSLRKACHWRYVR